MSDTKFAFGLDEVDGCECPASRCGYSPKDADLSKKIAQEYDTILTDETGNYEGIVDEETAKEAWLEANEEISDGQAGVSAEAEVGAKIAEELGWLENQDDLE
jgi:hypothetical protein